MDVPPHLRKFVSELGTLPDFVAYVRAAEARVGSTKARVLMRTQDISAFSQQGMPPFTQRYLILKKGPARIIDFLHFFAAASQSYCGQTGANMFGFRIGSSFGGAMMLGLANEISQCVRESALSVYDSATAGKLISRIDSCFSAEDLGSNRLGAQFGRVLVAAEAEARNRPVSVELREFLKRYNPATAAEIQRVIIPSTAEQVVEAIMAIVAGAESLIFTPAY